MNSYIFITMLAYLCFALTGIGDKLILTKSIKHPLSYAFFVGIFSPIVIILGPLGLRMIEFDQMLVAFFGGACFVYALYFFYSAIAESSSSRVVPIEGGLVPVATLILAFFVVDERLSGLQIIAYSLLVIGAVLISFERVEKGMIPKSLLNAAIAAIFFATALTLYKYTFNQTNFISGLIWTRMGLFIGALTFLTFKRGRNIILSSENKPKVISNKWLFIANFFLGSSGGLLQSYAIFLGSVTIVSAMQGVQFVFILGLSVLFSLYLPKVFKEDISRSILAQKIVAIILIASGLVILSLL